MNNVLVFVLHPTSRRVMIPLAKGIKGRGIFNPVVISLPPDILTDTASINSGLEYFPSPATFDPKSNSKKERVKLLKQSLINIHGVNLLRRWRRKFIRNWNSGFLMQSWLLKQRLVTAVRVLNRYDPCALLLPDDRILPLIPFIKAAQNRNVSTIVAPVSFSNLTGVSIRRADRPKCWISGGFVPLWNRYVSWRYPEQVHEFGGRKLLFYTGSVVQALAFHEMLPSNPWVVGGGHSDYLAVDAFDSKEQAVKYGVLEEKIRVTGHISHDVLHHRLVNKEKIYADIIAKYSFDPSKRLILCAVPHLAEHNMITWEKHWEDVENLLTKLVKTEQNVLLSLHPKSDSQRYAYLEEKHNCRIAQENLDQVIAAAWLFVAGYTSTIRWAALCEVPTIVVDFNQLGYDLYDHWDGVIKAKSPQLLETSLDRICQNTAYYISLQQKQRRVARELTYFDGNASLRIHNLIEQAIVQRGEQTIQN